MIDTSSYEEALHEKANVAVAFLARDVNRFSMPGKPHNVRVESSSHSENGI